MQYSLAFSSVPALTAFWLMMASMATAVLPVWRAPMISSRWPRPIGIRVSMAFRPVCTGSCTDLRGMIPGAFTSTRRRSATLVSSPLPSMGLPRGSTTRPSRPLPTRSEEHTSELQSHSDLVCRLLLENKKLLFEGGRTERSDLLFYSFNAVLKLDLND